MHNNFTHGGKLWRCSVVNCRENVITWRHFLHYCLLWCGQQAVEQTVELTMIWDTIMLMWCHCNDCCKCNAFILFKNHKLFLQHLFCFIPGFYGRPFLLEPFYNCLYLWWWKPSLEVQFECIVVYWISLPGISPLVSVWWCFEMTWNLVNIGPGIGLLAVAWWQAPCHHQNIIKTSSPWKCIRKCCTCKTALNENGSHFVQAYNSVLT